MATKPLTEARRAQAEVKRLKAALTKARLTIDALQAKLDALTPPRDPWQDTVEAFLADYPETDRWTAWNLLDALDIQTSHRDTDTYRRLARVMRAIGGWKASNNVADSSGYGRVRGYVRLREI